MAVKIELKRSSVPGKKPNLNQLDLGELAINTYDGKIFFKQDVSGVESIVEVASTSGSVASASYAAYAAQAGTASLALNANTATTASHALFAQQAQSASYSTNSSFAVSSSYATSASYVLFAEQAQSASYSVSSSFAVSSSYATSASHAPSSLTASYAISASHAEMAETASSADNFNVRGLLTGSTATFASSITASNALIQGTITAQTLVVQTISSSVIYSSGSNIFGDELTDVQQFTGSVTITGSLTVNGPATFNGSTNITNLTGSLFGTASWANIAINANTASVAPAYTLTSSFTNFTASYYTDSGSFSGSISNLSSSFLAFSQSYNTGSFTGSFQGDLIGTASYAISASHAPSALTASYAISASQADNANTATSSSYSLSSSYAVTSSITTQTRFTGSFTGSFNGVFSGSFSGSVANIKGTPTYVALFESNNTLATSSIFQSGAYSVVINQTANTTDHPEALYVWQPSTSSFNVISGKGNLNNYLQLNIQNTNQGVNASSDVVATANNGDENSFYIDMGINGENFSGPIGGPNDAYLYATGNNFHVGNASTNGSHLGFFVGGNDVEADNKLTLRPTNQHDLTGSLEISGSLTVLKGITGSLYGTASWAQNSTSASYALSSSFALTASYASNVPETASYALTASTAISSSYALSGSYSLTATSASHAISADNVISSSYSLSSSYSNTSISASHALNADSAISSSYSVSSSYSSTATSASYATTASYAENATNAISSSYAATASSADSFFVRNNITASNILASGTVTAQTLVVQTITSSVVYSSGSNIFGNSLSDTQILTGSVTVTGSLSVNNSAVILSNQTSSMSVLSSSYAFNADLLDGKDSSTFATTGSNIFVGNQTVTGSLFTSGSNTLIGNTSLTGSLNVSGSTVQIGNNTLTGNTQLTGSIGVSGSQTFVGNQTLTGSFLVSGSTTQVGNNTLFGNTVLSGSIIISSSQAPGNLAASVNIFGDTAVSGFIRFNPYSTNIDTSISASYVYVSGSTNDLYFSQNGAGYTNTTRLRWLEGNLYTGLLNGGLITTQSSTVYQVSSGSGIIVNLNASINDNPYPTVQYLNWGNLTGSISAFTSSYQQLFVGIQSNGTLFAQGTPFYNGQVDVLIPVGDVFFQNGTTINGVKTAPGLAYGWKQRSNVFIQAFGPLKLSGFTLAPSGSSTGSLVVGSGTAFADGQNYVIDPNNPSYIVDAGTNVSKIYRYYDSGSSFVYQTNAGAGYGSIDPTNYSNNGTLTSVGAGNWSLQRVFWFPNSVTKAIIVYYGNAIYPTEAEAIANLNVETFVEAPNTAANAVYLGAIAISGNGTFTNTNTYKLLPGGLFRQVGGSGGGGSTVTQTLAGLSDVSISGPTNLQPLAYSTTAGKWINTSFLSASIAGSATTATSASYALSSSYALTASYAQTATTASYLANVVYTTGSQSISGFKTFTDRTTFNNHIVMDGTGSTNYTLAFKQPSALNFYSGDYTEIGAFGGTEIDFNFGILSGGYRRFAFNVANLSISTPRTYQFPDKTGILLIDDITSGSVATASLALSAATAQTSSIATSASYALTASYASTAISASYSATASSADSFLVRQSLTASNALINGTITAQTLVVQTVTSSVVYSSGSNVFGNNLSDTQIFTGSVSITGSLSVANGINNLTASNAVSASYALTASYIPTSSLVGDFFVQGGNSFGAPATLGTNDAQNLQLETNGSVRVTVSGSNGFVGIDTVAPAYKLDVNGEIRAKTDAFIHNPTGEARLELGRSITGSRAVMFSDYTAGLVYYDSGFSNYVYYYNAISDSTAFQTNGSDKLTITKSGSLQFNAYTTNGLLKTTGSNGTVVMATASVDYVIPSTLNNYILNSQTSSMSVLSSSYALTATSASYALNSTTSSYALTATSASYALNTTSASYALNATSASYASVATTASNALTASSADDFIVRGTLTAQTIVAQTITSSTEYVTGSTQFGSLLTNTHQFTGSVSITGSLSVANGINNLTASNAITASYALNATSASFAQTANTASYVLNAVSASYSFNSTSASYAFNATNALTASYLSGYVSPFPYTGSAQITGSLGVTGSLSVTQGITGSLFGTASWAQNATSASYVLNAISASHALTASYVNPLRQTVQITGSTAALSIIGSGSGLFTVDGTLGRIFTIDDTISGSLFSVNTGSLAILEVFSDKKINMSGSVVITGSLNVISSITGSLLGTSSYAITASFADSASYAATSSYATTFVIKDTLTLDATLTDYYTVASSIVGTNNLFTRPTGSFTSAFFKYTVSNGANARTGEVMTVWNGTTTVYTDTSTTDIGATSPVTCSAVIVGSDVQFNIQTNTSGWKLKSLATFM